MDILPLGQEVLVAVYAVKTRQESSIVRSRHSHLDIRMYTFDVEDTFVSTSERGLEHHYDVPMTSTIDVMLLHCFPVLYGHGEVGEEAGQSPIRDVSYLYESQPKTDF